MEEGAGAEAREEARLGNVVVDKKSVSESAQPTRAAVDAAKE